MAPRLKTQSWKASLQRLGFKSYPTPDGWSVEVPSHRMDIGFEEDRLDEIARQHGFDQFPATLPPNAGYGAGCPFEAEERLLRNRVAGQGYSEAVTIAFSDEQTERRFRPDVEPVKLLNPMAEDESILRTSLVPSMLRSLQWNLNRGIRDLQLYELGKVYRQRYRGTLAHFGGAPGMLRPKSVHETERAVNFYDIKGDVEDVLQVFDSDGGFIGRQTAVVLSPGRFARVGKTALFGELHPEYAEHFKLRTRVYIAELNIDVILRSRRLIRLKPFRSFPRSGAIFPCW